MTTTTQPPRAALTLPMAIRWYRSAVDGRSVVTITSLILAYDWGRWLSTSRVQGAGKVNR